MEEMALERQAADHRREGDVPVDERPLVVLHQAVLSVLRG